MLLSAAARPTGSPRGELTLAEKQAITRAMLRSGAPIGEINTVRKHISRIKGGRLAQAARNARSLLTLAISDVPFDDPAVIASGPSVPDPSTLTEAREICERRGIALPEAAAALLKRSEERIAQARRPGLRPRPPTASSPARRTPSTRRPPPPGRRATSR